MVNLPPALKPLFAVKSFESLQTQASKSQMKRELGALDVTLIGIGEIVGAGIFVVTGKAAALYAGPALILSFIIAGTVCAFAGLCYAEMAATVPIAGSAYTYAYATCGELIGWIVGWDLMLEYLIGAATVAVGWSGYLVNFLTKLGMDIPDAWVNAPIAYSDEKGFIAGTGILNLPAIAVVVFTTIVLCFGVRQTAWFNHTFCAIKLGVIFLFLFSTVGYINPANWSPFIPGPDGEREYGWGGIFRASTLVFFAYIGFDAVSTTAQEVKNPGRDMPIGILGSLSICTVIYIAVSATITGIAPFKTLDSPAPIAKAVAELGMRWLEISISVGGIAGLTSVILISLMAQPRIFYAMAYDGLLPPAFGQINEKYGTPLFQTVLSGVICAVAAGLLPLEVLGDITSAGTLFAFAMVSAAVGVLRYTRPDLERPFRVPLGNILIPFLGFATAMGLVIQTGGATILRLVIWLVIGLIIYFTYSVRHSVLRTGKAVEGIASQEAFGGHGGHGHDAEKPKESA